MSRPRHQREQSQPPATAVESVPHEPAGGAARVDPVEADPTELDLAVRLASRRTARAEPAAPTSPRSWSATGRRSSLSPRSPASSSSRSSSSSRLPRRPTPAPRSGSLPRRRARQPAPPDPGYVQPDMGRRHVAVGEKVTYTYCPPASGSHYNAANAGPIQPRFYGPNDRVLPEGWIHNLEHGAMVILYRGHEAIRASRTTARPRSGRSTTASRRARSAASPGHQHRSGHRPLRRDGDAVCRAGLGSGPAPRPAGLRRDLRATGGIWGEQTNPEKQCAAPSPSPSAS